MVQTEHAEAILSFRTDRQEMQSHCRQQTRILNAGAAFCSNYTGAGLKCPVLRNATEIGSAFERN